MLKKLFVLKTSSTLLINVHHSHQHAASTVWYSPLETPTFFCFELLGTSLLSLSLDSLSSLKVTFSYTSCRFLSPFQYSGHMVSAVQNIDVSIFRWVTLKLFVLVRDLYKSDIFRLVGKNWQPVLIKNTSHLTLDDFGTPLRTLQVVGKIQCYIAKLFVKFILYYSFYVT